MNVARGIVAAIVRAVATGPGFALVGYLAAILIHLFTGAPPVPFTSEFHAKYGGLWLVPGGIGVLLGLVNLIVWLRGRKHRAH